MNDESFVPESHVKDEIKDGEKVNLIYIIILVVINNYIFIMLIYSIVIYNRLSVTVSLRSLGIKPTCPSR